MTVVYIPVSDIDPGYQLFTAIEERYEQSLLPLDMHSVFQSTDDGRKAGGEPAKGKAVRIFT